MCWPVEEVKCCVQLSLLMDGRWASEASTRGETCHRAGGGSKEPRVLHVLLVALEVQDVSSSGGSWDMESCSHP